MLTGYEILGKLGEGGMGAVFRARQISLDRIVALKMLPAHLSANRKDMERFKREARAVAQLNHPGIVQIYESGEFDGKYYYTMEYVEGYTIGDWLLRKGVLSEDQALVVCIAVAEALNYAWTTARIIHRDIKPENILINKDGSVKVADLGLAKIVDNRNTVTMPGETVGTPSYCSPEQAQGKKDIDCRTDMYSLGAMLYHMVTGKVPFGDVSGVSAMVRHVTHQLDDPLEENPALSPGLGLLLEKMMAKKPEYRHADWDELLGDLQAVLNRKPPRHTLALGAKSTVRTTQRFKPGQPPQKKTPLVVGHLAGQGVAAAGMAPAQTPRPAGNKVNPVLIGGGVVVAIVTIVIIIVAATHKEPPVSRVADPPAVTQEEAAAAQALQEAGTAFKQAQDFLVRNPQDLDGALAKFHEIAPKLAKTPYEAQAADETRRIGLARQAAIQKVLDDLQHKAGPLAEQGRRNEAVAVYRTYSGPYAEATAAQRETLAKALTVSAPAVVAGKDDVIKEIFDMAVDYARKNPTEFDNAIRRFEEVRDKAKDTPWEEKSRGEILKITQARDQAVVDLMNALKQRADILVKQGNVRDAQKLYRDYNGALAAITAAPRMKAADALDAPGDGVMPQDDRAMRLLAENEKIFQERKQENADQYDRYLQNLATNYLQNLGDLAEFMRKNNDHARLKQIRLELTRFQREKTVPLNPMPKPSEEVRKIQAWYMDEKNDIDRVKSRNMVKIADSFSDYLKEMEHEALANGQKNVIPKVRELANRVAADPDVKDAQQFLAKRDKEKK